MLAHARRLSARTNARHGALFNGSVSPTTQRLFMGLPYSTDASQRKSIQSHQPLLAPVRTPMAPLAVRIYGFQSASLFSPFVSLQTRSFARRSGRNPWENPWESIDGKTDWVSVVKTGALLAVGAGAVVAAASVGFGFVVFGAAGYGIYSLYQRFFAPYRSNDPFSSVQADIDRIFNRQQSTPRSAKRSAASVDNDLDSLVQGLPFVVRGLLKTVLSFAGGVLKSSMARAGELRRLANDAMRANASIVAQMGSDVSISTPRNWTEYTVNGAGRVEAVFGVTGEGYAQAQVTAKASVRTNGELTLEELKYHNRRTGEVIDLLRDGGAPSGTRRKKIVEADYVDLDDRQ